MGTSTPYKGGKNDNPLLPSWIGAGADAGDGSGGDTGASGDAPAAGGEGGSPGGEGQPASGQPEQAGDPSRRYTGPRSNFTRFTRSGGDDRRALGRAASSYVKRTGGGAATTSRRMAAERSAATNLAGILSRASGAPGGIREVVRTLNFGALADRPIQDIYAALVDLICPPDGDLDDAHAREAYLEAVNEVMQDQPSDLERPSPETIKDIIGKFIANAVNQRIIMAIGLGIIVLPSDSDEIRAVEKGLKDFIRGCVAETMDEFSGDFRETDLRPEIDAIFERTVEVVGERGEDAANEAAP